MQTFVRPIFFSDAAGHYLLPQSGVRYVNVFENSFGDQYFGQAHKDKVLADITANSSKRHAGAVYRIVVKAKRNG